MEEVTPINGFIPIPPSKKYPFYKFILNSNRQKGKKKWKITLNPL